MVRSFGMSPGMNLISPDSALDQYSNLDITQKLMDEFSQKIDSKADWAFMNTSRIWISFKNGHNSKSNGLNLLFEQHTTQTQAADI